VKRFKRIIGLGAALSCLAASVLLIGPAAAESGSSQKSQGTPSPKGLTKVPAFAGTQYGINIRWSYSNQSAATLSKELKATLSYCKSLGANSVSFAFDIYIASGSSNTIISGPGTPPPGIVGEATAVARRDGFFVLLRPLITEINPSQPWRGAIHPTNRNAWFTSYDNFLKPYLVDAQTNGANEVAYSVELGSLSGLPQWKTMVLPFSKKYYKGALMYNVSWYPPGMRPMANEYYGIDAYPAMQLPDSASVKQLLAGWNAWLKQYPVGAALTKTYITEVGLAAESDAYTHPSYVNWNTPIIPSIQSKWFQAACEFFNQHKFKGLWFFSTSLNEGPQKAAIGGKAWDFQGLSLPVIKKCFSGS
jgi:hypothetical protein